jgi:carbonic anhydrase
MFDDVLDANRRYQTEFHDSGVPGRAAKGLAVLTCIDSRIDPLAMLGLRPGDAKIIRNAGARVTDDALRSLVLAANLLGVTRICVVQHTDCAMTKTTDGELRGRLSAERGVDADGWVFYAIEDPPRVMRDDIERIRSCGLIPPGTVVGGFVYDVHSGALQPVID